MEDIIKNCIHKALSKADTNVFDELDKEFISFWDKPCTSMLELKKRTTKEKGTLFEVFCKLYLQQKGYTVWMLSECPEDILEMLGMTSHDVGIDLIARIDQKDKTGKFLQTLWFPVQCKYRVPHKDLAGRMSHKLSWKEVSTFLSLCTRTGPILSGKIRGWAKHIIMTNCSNVSWKGRKSQKDWTIAKSSFSKPNKIFWINWINKKTVATPSITSCQPSTAEIINLREKWLSSLCK